MVFTGLTQEWGIDVLEAHMKKEGKTDPQLISTLREIAGGAVESGQGYDHFFSRVTVPDDVKLVLSDGSVVGDEVCLGDSFFLKKNTPKGEFWQDGGDLDSPPIYWVDDAENVTYKLLYKIQESYRKREYVPAQQRYKIMNYLRNSSIVDTQDLFDIFLPKCDNVPDIDLFSGMPLYQTVADSDTSLFRDFAGNNVGVVFCSINEKKSSIGGSSYSGGMYTVKNPGVLNIESLFSLKCAYYAYEYRMNLKAVNELIKNMGFDVQLYEMNEDYCFLVQAPAIPLHVGDYCLRLDNPACEKDYDHAKTGMHGFFVLSVFGFNKSVKVVQPANPSVDFVVYDSGLVFGRDNILRLVVKNVGDVGVQLSEVSASSEYRYISCDSNSLEPGAEAECLVSVNPKPGEGLNVAVSYTYKSCGRSKSGSVSKVLVESKKVVPSSSAQVYSVSVYGDCENSYFYCSSPDKGGMFSAGYSCYNTENRHWSPMKSRFNMVFDLPDLPADAVILGANLKLYVLGVGKPQTVSLYSADDGWSGLSCVAGGDICTQPYCAECRPLFDAGLNSVSVLMVADAGVKTFDVKSVIEAAYASGRRKVSFQVRGEEGLWELNGASSCGNINSWTRYDIEFSDVGVSKPYLEITYR